MFLRSIVRQSVAVLLVAWYLVTPPIGDKRAPYFRWNVYEKFDSEEGCGKSRDLEIELVKEILKLQDHS